jgi:hypothetical protein
MNFILGLVFFLSIMFLAMIFGERLSLFGFADGRWLTAPFDMLARLWDMICEATDRIWCFVFDHFWWVTATVSGSIGVLLVALIMVSGLSTEAAAVRVEEQTVMPVGSVLDHTSVIDSDNVQMTNAIATRDDVSQLMYQVPSAVRGEQHFPARLPLAWETQPPPEKYVPRVPSIQEPLYSRSRLELKFDRDEERVELIGSPDRLVERALAQLRNDISWRRSGLNGLSGRSAGSRPPMTEDPEFAVGDLTSRVHVIPGDAVSSSNLKVEKVAPKNPGRGDFEILIRLTNLSRDRVSGIVVREQLPFAWVPKQMQPRGVFRGTTVTWLVNDLAPFQDEVLTLQVESTESGRFESVTEVSATAAVTKDVSIVRQARPLPPVTTPIEPLSSRGREPLRFLDPVREPARSPVKLPDVRLILESEPKTVNVGESVRVNFRIENVGTVPAVGMTILVNLTQGLDHEDLRDGDLNREVDAKIAQLNPGESRRIPLLVKPVFRGRHFATAELKLQNQQLSITPFEIVAQEVASRPFTPAPTPEFP